MKDKLKTKKWKICLISTLSSFILFYSSIQVWAKADPHANHKAIQKKTSILKESTQTYNLPNITLTNHYGAKKTVKELFNKERTIVLNFIFTTCNTICPIMSGTFARFDKALKKTSIKADLVSISIDPEFDTTKELQRYAKVFEASKNWNFFTGNRYDIVELQTAFNAYRGSKMNHVPITLIKHPNTEKWIRIDGFVTSDELILKLQKTNMPSPKLVVHSHQ